MIAGKIAFTAGAFAASLLSGVSLGGYTIGGFRQHQPIDIIAETATSRSRDAFVAAPLPQAPVRHVCTGCDAKLYRDVAWDQAEASYLPDDGQATEGEGRWSVAEDSVPPDPVPVEPVSVDTGAAGPDGSLAVYEAPVVVAPDHPQGW